MGTPSSFQIGQMGAQGMQNSQDRRVIEEILQKAQNSQRSQDIENLLNQVVSRVSPEKQQNPLALLQNRQQVLQQEKQLTGQQEYARSLNLPENTPLEVLKEFGKQRAKQNPEMDKANLETIESNFGFPAAKLYQALPTGAKTDFFKALLQNAMRGGKVEDIMNQFQQYAPAPREREDLIDFDKGLTPSEKIKRQDDRYKINLPYQQEANTRRTSLENIDQDLKILEELSPQISAFERFNINPTTGDIIIPALASPEAQRFLKTINDFTTQAKDTFGSRVTNFDLQQFLRRLPTLANSEEGRRQILKQMQLINDINLARENSINDVIDEYGGIRNIDYDQAIKLGEKRSKSRIENLRREFKTISSNADRDFTKNIEELKKKAPHGQITVQKPDGDIGYIKKEVKEEFFKKYPTAKEL